MSSTTFGKCPALKDGFTWYERLLVRVGLSGLVGVGAVGIYLQNPGAAAGYLAFVLVGALLVVYDFICVYCPYPYQYNDCLFFPPALLTRVVKQRSGEIPRVRSVLLALTAVGLILAPQYWLCGNWVLLVSFWLLAVALGLSFPLYFCGRCRHGRCALNRACPADASPLADASEPRG